MITINATGDTTLHTAGKYCPEDILVKVPGTGGGSEIKTCRIVILDSGDISYTAVENGEIVAAEQRLEFSSETSITVLCDSIIYYNYGSRMVQSIEVPEGFSVIYHDSQIAIVRVSSTPGVVGEIIIIEDTGDE